MGPLHVSSVLLLVRVLCVVRVFYVTRDGADGATLTVGHSAR